MRRAVLPALMVLLALAPGASRAQEATPWPPDPDAIFAEGVEVVDVREGVIEAAFTPPEDITTHVDNDGGVVRVYNEETATWTAYPFPETVTFFDSRVSMRSDGLLRLDPPGYGGSRNPADTWLLDPITGEYSHPEIMCGTVRDAEGEGQWVVTPIERDAPEHRLCFTETGELTEPLLSSSRNSPSAILYWTAIATNPTKEWVLLGAQGCLGTFYAYHIATDELTRSGRNRVTETGGLGGDRCYVETWLDDTFFLMFVEGMPEYSEHSIYAGDVAQPESLELVLSSIRFWPTYYDDPPRYEFVPGMTLDGIGWRGWDGQGPSCQLQIYYLEARQRVDYPLGELCTPNLVAPEDTNMHFFRYVSLDLGQPAVLASYNLQTRQRTDLFTGEIEAVTNISPDGRYIILLMDDNGRIDAIPDVDFLRWTEWRHPYWAVFDTEQREIVYQIPDAPIFYTNFDLPSADWFEADAFSFSQIHPGYGSEYMSWVWIESEKTVTLAGVIARQASLDQQRILVRTVHPVSEDPPYQPVCTIGVVDLTSETYRPITKELYDCLYSVDAEWLNDGSLIITISTGDTDEPRPAYIYTIRLPQSDSQ